MTTTPGDPGGEARGLPPALNPRGPGASGTHTREHPRRRSGRRVLAWIAGSLAVLVLLVSAVGWGLLTYTEGRIHRVDVFGGLKNRPEKTSNAVNYLLVGSDTREGLTKAELARLRVGSASSAAGRRSDTMILVHVSKNQTKATLVSFPRDSYVEVPGLGKAKLNASYGLGGPRLVVQTIEKATGIRIDHYVEINFAGFTGMVDALGGVEVCTPRSIRDPNSHLKLAAGTHKLDGVDSLKYVRSRDYDGRGDIGRMERQQGFIASMMREAISSGVLLNPIKLTRFVNATLASVQTDPGLSHNDILTLAKKLRSMSPTKVTFATVPIANPDYRPGGLGSTVLWNETAARALFTQIRDDQPVGVPTPAASGAAKTVVSVPPNQVRVQVLNGAGRAGLGTTATNDLAKAGFATAGPPRNASSSGATQTVIRYDSRYSESVKTIAAALPGARLEKVTGLGRTFQVVVGSSYSGVTRVTVVPRASASPSGSATPALTTRTAADTSCR